MLVLISLPQSFIIYRISASGGPVEIPAVEETISPFLTTASPTHFRAQDQTASTAESMHAGAIQSHLPMTMF